MAQSHTIPTLDRNNDWLGLNSFSQSPQVPEPTGPKDAVPKDYVDTHSGGGSLPQGIPFTVTSGGTPQTATFVNVIALWSGCSSSSNILNFQGTCGDDFGVNATFSGNLAANASLAKFPVADVALYGTPGVTCTGGSEDDTAALQAAINATAGTSVPVRISGVCRISNKITLPSGSSGACEWHVVAASQGAQIQAIVGFPANTGMLYRPAGTVSCPQTAGIDGVVLNANQIASQALVVQEQRILNLTNVTILDATGGSVGAEVILGISGGSSRLVGLHSTNLFIDNTATISGVGGAAARPAYGEVMYSNVDDSDQYNTVVDHIRIAGIANYGTNNSFTMFHPWGYGPGGPVANTWPQFGFEDHSFTADLISPEFDTIQFAGVDSINGQTTVLGGKVVCNDGGDGSACGPYIVQAESGAGNFFLYGTKYQAGSLSAAGSPINWIGTPDVTTSTYITQWGQSQIAGRSNLHLASGGNFAVADNLKVTGLADFLDGINNLPASNATSIANVLPKDTQNTASVWDGTNSQGATWNWRRFTNASGIPNFDQYVITPPCGSSTYPGTGACRFGVANLTIPTSANYAAPDLIIQGACQSCIGNKSTWFWRQGYGTGANPTDTLNLENDGGSSGAKSISALFPWIVTSLIANTGNVQATLGSLLSSQGSASVPSWSSLEDLTTGWHFPAAGQTEWTSGGIDQVILAAGQAAFRSTFGLRWASSGPTTTGSDTGLSRSAAGVMSVDTTTSQDGLGALKLASVIPGVLYSAAGTPLPACSFGTRGQQAVVSDATTPTYLGAYTSGGAVIAPVLCNGSSWVTH
jgi:hypothetical protein